MITKNIQLTISIILLSSFCISNSMEIPEESLFSSQKIGPVKLYYENSEFCVYNNCHYYKIPKCFTDKELWNISQQKLAIMLKNNMYLDLSYSEVGTFILRLKGRLLGSGLGGAAAGFYVAKTIASVALWGIVMTNDYIVGQQPIGETAEEIATQILQKRTTEEKIETMSTGIACLGAVIGGVVSGPG